MYFLRYSWPKALELLRHVAFPLETGTMSGIMISPTVSESRTLYQASLASLIESYSVSYPCQSWNKEIFATRYFQFADETDWKREVFRFCMEAIRWLC